MRSGQVQSKAKIEVTIVHTESCPDRNWGTSRNIPGLMGDVTDMEGRSIFWDSKELEPYNHN